MAEEAKLNATAADDFDMEALQKIFDFYDQDGNQTISMRELGSVLKAAGLYKNEKQVEGMVAAGDQNGDGVLDFAEFMTLITLYVSALCMLMSPLDCWT